MCFLTTFNIQNPNSRHSGYVTQPFLDKENPLRLFPALVLGASFLAPLPTWSQAPAKAPKAKAKAVAAAPLAAPVKVTSVEGITEYRLGNGLRVLLFPDPSKPTVTVNITYLVGSRHENYGETGMAHLLEHLVFKGTDKHPDVPKILNSVGARFNGTTNTDRTNYFVSFPSTDANLSTILDLEADRMVNSHIWKKDLWDDASQKGEMTVVRNEMESGENNAFGVTMQRTMAAAFEWHNYGKSTIGAKSDVENVNIERLQAFYHNYYQPDNAILLLAGKFDETKALSEINEKFGRLAKPARVLQPTYTLDPVQDGERSVTVRRTGDTPALMAAYKVPAGSDPDMASMDVLIQALGDQPSGRLHKAMVETKKAAAAFGFGLDTKEPGLVLFGAILPKGGDLDAARETMLATTEQLAKEPITQAEVDRAKQALLKQVDLMLNDSARVGMGLSEYMAQGDWRLFFLQRDRVKAVTAADVNRVAQAYLKPSNRTVGQFIPTEKPERSEIPAMKDVAGMLKDYKGQALVAQGETFDTAPAAIEARVQRATTKAGLKLALLPKKTRGESVSLALTLHFGDEKTLMNKGTAGQLTASMLDRGTAKHTRQELKDAFDKLKAQVMVMGGDERAQVMVTTVSKSLPELLPLLAEMLQAPTFPQTEFETLVNEGVAGMEYQRSEPQVKAGQALQAHLNPYPKGHPRFVASIDESIAEFKAAKLDDLKAFHKAFYGASAGELSVVGDFDAKALQMQVEQLFGAWVSPTPHTRIPVLAPAVAPLKVSIETPDKANAMLQAGFNLQMQDNDPDYPAMLMGNYMLGGGALKSRLADRIRQKEGLSYGVGSRFQANAQDKAGTWTAFAIFNPANTAKVEAALIEEIQKALKDGFNAEELQSARTSWLQGQAQSRAQDRELAGRLAGNLNLGRTLAFQAELEQKVSALSVDQVNVAVRKHLDPTKLSIVKAGDFAKVAATAGAVAVK